MTLKKLLAEKDITMYKLAKDTGLGQSTINEIVNGKRKSIKLDTAIKIAAVLDTGAEEIYKSIKED